MAPGFHGADPVWRSRRGWESLQTPQPGFLAKKSEPEAPVFDEVRPFRSHCLAKILHDTPLPTEGRHLRTATHRPPRPPPETPDAEAIGDKKYFRFAVLLGVGLAAFQQLCGINGCKCVGSRDCLTR